MTEEEWLSNPRVQPMIDFLSSMAGLIYKGRVQQHPRGRRRLRLFGVAVARRVVHLVSEPCLTQLLDAAEAFADGTGTLQELEKLERLSVFSVWWEALSEHSDKNWLRDRMRQDNYREIFAAQSITILASRDALSSCCLYKNAAFALMGDNMLGEIAGLLRDIFGNPFRPAAFDPAWRTSTAIALAQQMYDARDFSIMPILGDALQDAGCDSDDILTHCRDASGTHVRGCWVVDLVLGKS